MANNPDENGGSGQERYGVLRTLMRWGIPATLFIISLVFGFLGFRQHAIQQGDERSLLDLTYRSFQLFTLESGAVEPPVPWTLETARWTAPVLPLYAAILGLLTLFSRFFRSERVRLYRNHVVICGAGLKGMTLAQNLHADGVKVVVLERDPANPNLRLLGRLGIPVFIGDATARQHLRRTRINQARHFVALCGEDQTNVSVAVAARSFWKNRTQGAITCHIDVENREACRALIEKELHDWETPRCWLEFHKSDDIAARKLLQDQAKIFTGRKGTEPPSILFVGLDSMGRSLLLAAARIWSDLAESSELKLRYTVIGEGLEAALASTLERHPPLKRWSQPDPILEPIKTLADLKSRYGDGEGSADSQASPGGSLPRFDLVFICADHDDETLSLALETHRFLRDVAPETEIFVPTYENQGFRRFLPGPEDDCGYYRAISVVSVLEKSFNTEFLKKGVIEEMARWVHSYYMQNGDPAQDGSKPNLVGWDVLTDDTRLANYAQARRIFEHLSGQGFRIDPSREWKFEPIAFEEPLIEKLARAEHDRWCAERRDRGWRQGRRTNPRKVWDRIFPWRWKRHDCLVPWGELPESEKQTDRDMVMKWPAILAKVGFQIRPVDFALCEAASPEM